MCSISANDVVVYDRGYFSYVMLQEHVKRGIHPIFRLKAKANNVVNAFAGSDETDISVEITASKEVQQEMREKYGDDRCKPILMRLVKYNFAGTTYILGTTLLDQSKYPIEDLSDVYHSRWGIEELYKISKQLMDVEDFHGQSERGVKQEVFAHFVLIALTRIFSNHSEDSFNSGSAESGTRKIQANFKNSLVTVARHIEGLLLQQATLLTETINKIVVSISSCKQKQRPNRFYERRSRKPVGKWFKPKPAKATGNVPAAAN